MKTIIFPGIISAVLLFQISVFGQGALTPPGVPAPTMKSLSQVEPRTPISSIPITISTPGSYYVTTNLTGINGQHGITINSDNVVLDLGGFTLFGVPGSVNGIFIITTHTNIVIRNGCVTAWGNIGVNGFTSGFPRNVIYENLVISSCPIGLDAEAGSIIRDCAVTGCTNAGIFSVGSVITGCSVRQNSSAGINVSFSSVRNCTIENNGTGAYLNYSTLADCVIDNSTLDGVDMTDTCQVVNNRIADNPNLSGSAIRILGANNYVAGNAVLNNGFGLVASVAGVTNNCILQNRFLNSQNTVVSSANIFPSVELGPAQAGNFTNGNALVNIIFP